MAKNEVPCPSGNSTSKCLAIEPSRLFPAFAGCRSRVSLVVGRNDPVHHRFGTRDVGQFLKLRKQPLAVQAGRQIPVSKKAALQRNETIVFDPNIKVDRVHLQPAKFRPDRVEKHDIRSICVPVSLNRDRTDGAFGVAANPRAGWRVEAAARSAGDRLPGGPRETVVASWARLSGEVTSGSLGPLHIQKQHLQLLYSVMQNIASVQFTDFASEG
jgi:hypothetical protein